MKRFLKAIFALAVLITPPLLIADSFSTSGVRKFENYINGGDFEWWTNNSGTKQRSLLMDQSGTITLGNTTNWSGPDTINASTIFQINPVSGGQADITAFTNFEVTTNSYIDASGALKSLATKTGWGDLHIGSTSNANAGEFYALNNHVDAQTANAAQITTNENYMFICTAKGQCTLGDPNLPASFPGELIVGENDGGLVATGYVGELLKSTQTNVTAATTGNFKQVATITLPIGDWDIAAWGQVIYGGSTTSVGSCEAAISATTASGSGTTLGFDAIQFLGASNPSTNPFAAFAIPRKDVQITSSTPYFLNILCNFATATPTYFATISARRMH